MVDYKKISAIVLSGGRSSRMGEDKCDLVFDGETLLNLQIDKLRSIGIDDIIASGYRGKNAKAKVVHDDIMKGPLSGILLGLKEIENDRAFVISVDVPLVKWTYIKKIIDYSYEKDLDMAMIRHNGNREPLMGVYKKSLIPVIEDILNGDKYSVMKLADTVRHEFLDIDDDDKYFLNVNNKEDYDMLLKINVRGGK